MLPDIRVRAVADVNQAVGGLDRLGDEYQRTGQRAEAAGKQTGAFNRALPQAGRSSQAFGRAVQQASFQVGDFATQVGAGTRASVALGQQLPQLLGGFGVLGAAMGAIVAIGVPLTRALFSAGDEAKSLTEAVDEASSSIKAFRAASDETRLSLAGLVESYGTASETLRGVLNDLKEIERVKAFEAIDAVAASLDDMFEGFFAREKYISEMLGGFALDLLKDDFKAVVEQFDNFSDRMRSSASVAEKLQYALNLKQILEENSSSYEDMTDEQRQFYDGLVKIIRDLEIMKSATAGVVDNVTKLTSETEKLEVAFLNAAKAASSIALPAPPAVEEAALGPAKELIAGRTNSEWAAGYKALAAFHNRGDTTPDKPKGRGGSSRSSGPITQSLFADLATAREQLAMWRDEKMEILSNANAAELEALGGHNEAKIRLEEEYQRRLADIRQNEARERVQTIQNWTSTIGSIMSSFGDMMESETRQQFERQKKIRQAAAIVEGIGAAVAAWRSGMEAGGLPLAAAYTVASVAQTAAQIAAIGRQSYNGGGGGVGAGGAPSVSAPQQQQQAPRPQANLTLIGDYFSRAHLVQVAEALNDMSDDGSQLINIRGRR